MQGFMDLDDISVNHPRLINFSDRTVTQNILSYGKDNPITFPSRVKKLDLTYGYFATPKAEIEIEPERATKRRKPNHEEHGWSLNQWPKYQRIKFPESLVELRVDGSAKDLHRTKNVVVIDFRMCELPQLSVLSLDQTWNQIIVDNYLPHSLTRVHFNGVKGLPFHMLSDLENLVEIRIISCVLESNSDGQAAQFSVHLQVLDISSSTLYSPMACSKIHNIRSLTFKENNATIFTNCDRHQILIIPEISDIPWVNNKIGTFYNQTTQDDGFFTFDFEWMETLTELSFSSVCLVEFPRLPPYIEKVSLDFCSIEQFPSDENDSFSLPDTLEHLNLRGNYFDLDSLMSIHAPNLKCLDISMAPKFHLPEVSRETNSDSDEVSWTDTKVFSKFTKLEELILTNNNLSNLMPHELHPNIFGPSIKYLNVMGCNLSKETAKGIIDLVLAKPDFERLIIEDSLVGEEYQRWVDNITIVSDEEHL
ncbi:hypothetical protein K4I79_004713 [Candida tropicalis]